MTLNLRNLIELTVPHYLIITIFSTLSAALLLGDIIAPFKLGIAMLSLSLAVLGFNALNMIFDVEMDKINKPLRPIPSKRVTIKEAKIVSIIFFSLSIILSLFTNLAFLSLLVFYISVSIIYSTPPIRLRAIPFSSNIFGTFFYAIVPFLTAWTILNSGFPVVFFLFFVGIGLIMSPIKDIEDVEGEKRFGLITLSTVLGKKGVIYFILVSYFLLIASMLILSIFNIISQKFVYPSLFSLLLLVLLAKFFLGFLNEKEIVITQSKLVTVGMAISILIQLSYGIINVLIKM